MKKYLFALSFFVFFLVTPLAVSAHQPRVPDTMPQFVSEPEVSKAYYGKLGGKSDFYIIRSDQPFDLYVNILVPDKTGQQTDMSVTIVKDGKLIQDLDGTKFQWKKFFEPFGHDNYLMGPEYRARVEAGEYQVFVSNPQYSGSYSLAIGEREKFNFAETVNAVHLIPQIKKTFFKESPVSFLLSPIGIGYVVAMFVLAFIFGFIYRTLMKQLAAHSVRGRSKNIGFSDRLMRFILAVGLFVLAVTTSWNPILLFASGFVLFEAIFSWCGFYAAIGKTTCPLNV